MKITHCFDANTRITKSTKEETGFLLAHKTGGYVWLPSTPISRYQGWFFALGESAGSRLYRVIENIELQETGEIRELKNNFWSIQRKRANLVETFMLTDYTNALIYEVSAPSVIQLVLDIKDSYDNTEEGRLYEVETHGTSALVSFRHQYNNTPPLFLAIRANGKLHAINQWHARYYSLDQRRGSFPYNRYVFSAVRVKGSAIVCAVSDNKNTALKEADRAFGSLKEIKLQKKNEIKKFFHAPPRGEKEVVIASMNAKKSLQGLLVHSNEGKATGLYAGYPWFFQFWPRDEALSLKALSLCGGHGAANEIAGRLLRRISSEGIIVEEADAAGWAFIRAFELLQKSAKDYKKARRALAELLRQTLEQLLKYHTLQGLAEHGEKETWMDSLPRRRAGIEVQALRLRLYRIAARISSSWKQRRAFAKLEKELREKVRKLFWTGKTLADGFDQESRSADYAIRPNIFLAAYSYPHLLTKKEWSACFDHILPKLWLPWGGIASVEKANPAFHARHTGENPESYHQGDSWFYLNSLAAIVLFRLNRKKYKTHINSIVRASTHDILFHGIIGHHSELSSAEACTAEGALAQAWSSALYLELISLIENRYL